MAVVVEIGTGVAGANSFVTEAQFGVFADARGLTVTNAEQSLIKAMDYLLSVEGGMAGARTHESQETPYPRTGTKLHGVSVASDAIPPTLKSLQMMVAIEIEKGTDLYNPVQQKFVTEQRIEGAVTRKFAAPSSLPAFASLPFRNTLALFTSSGASSGFKQTSITR